MTVFFYLLVVTLMVGLVLSVSADSVIEPANTELTKPIVNQPAVHKVSQLDPLLVYLKFHKVGSQTVKDCMDAHFGLRQTDPVPWWNEARCMRGPFVHDILHVYRSHPNTELSLKADCVREPWASQHALEVTAVLRDPIERVISLMYFFHVALEKVLLYGQQNQQLGMLTPTASLYNFTAALATSALLVSTPRNITATQMRNMLGALYSLRAYKVHSSRGSANISALFNDLNIYEYEHTFSEVEDHIWAGPTVDTLETALIQMQRRVHAIGLTEHTSSFFMLLQRRYGLDASVTCGVHSDHGGSPIYHHLWLSNKRPPRNEIFTTEVLDVLADMLQNEVVIWQAAEALHIQQLATFGLTIATATAQYDQQCVLKAEQIKAAKAASEPTTSMMVKQRGVGRNTPVHHIRTRATRHIHI